MITLHSHETTITVVNGNATSPQPCLDRMLHKGSLAWPCRMAILGAQEGYTQVQVRRTDGWEDVAYVPPIVEFRVLGTGTLPVQFYTNNPDPKGDII